MLPVGLVATNVKAANYTLRETVDAIATGIFNVCYEPKCWR